MSNKPKQFKAKKQKQHILSEDEYNKFIEQFRQQLEEQNIIENEQHVIENSK